MNNESKLYSWWNVKHYCYICGVVGHIPGPGYWFVRRHLKRVAND